MCVFYSARAPETFALARKAVCRLTHVCTLTSRYRTHANTQLKLSCILTCITANNSISFPVQLLISSLVVQAEAPPFLVSGNSSIDFQSGFVERDISCHYLNKSTIFLLVMFVFFVYFLRNQLKHISSCSKHEHINLCVPYTGHRFSFFLCVLNVSAGHCSEQGPSVSVISGCALSQDYHMNGDSREWDQCYITTHHCAAAPCRHFTGKSLESKVIKKSFSTEISMQQFFKPP